MRKSEADIRAEAHAEHLRTMMWVHEQTKNSPHRKVWIRRRREAAERIVAGLPEGRKVVLIEIHDGYDPGPHVEIKRLDPDVELVIIDHEGGGQGTRHYAQRDGKIVEQKFRFPGGRKKT